MKRQILIILFLYFFKVIIFSNNYVVEGESVYGIKFGDKEKKVIKILGEPNYRIINKSKNPGEFVSIFFGKTLNIALANYITHILWGYRDENNNMMAFTQPFWRKCLVYIEKGIEVFIDKDNEVVEFILLSDALKFYFEEGYILQFKSFEGYLQKSGVYFSDDFYKYKERNKDRKDLYVLDPETSPPRKLENVYLSNLEKFKEDLINISGEGSYSLYYSKRTGKLLCVIMISKKIGGLEAPLSITL